MSELEAGRELDALVAEKLMGWTRPVAKKHERFAVGALHPPEDPNVTRLAPSYSTDIAAAWTVVEKWRERGEGFQLDSLGFRGEEWRCGFMDASGGGMDLNFAEEPTAPLAICRAALKAVSVSVSPSENRNGGELHQDKTENDQLKNHRRQDATT